MRQRQKKTADYYLGTLVGQIIFLKYLPTMNTDMLQSLHVIDVSEEDKAEVDRLHQILTDTYSDGTVPKTKYGMKESTEIAHKNWIDYINVLAEKYLPKKLECHFEKIKVGDFKEFKEGLTDYLWNTDLSWYMPEDDFWKETPDFSYRSTVILTLRIGS